MRFGILGPLEVRTDDGDPVAVPEKKVRALLARLLTDPGRPVGAARLVADLWDGEPPADPRAALHTKVSLLRRAIAPTRVERAGDAYLLDVEPVETDAGRFTDLTARAARATGAERADLLEQALDQWRGPALAEFDALTAAAAALDERRLAAREDLLETRLDLGHGVLADAADLAARHPGRERLQAIHMRALYAAGRHRDALDAYRAFRDRLAADLGLEPGPELQDLHRAILRHDPGLAPEPAPHRGNLPAPVTDLIGRDTELDRLTGGVAAARLTTLTGPGGVGKTSLALAAAARSAPGFGDGTWLVELGGFGDDADPDLLAAAAADAMGLGPGSGTRAARTAAAPAALLRSGLAGKTALIVLDNCEHVAAAAAELARRLLAASSGVRVLTTSREPLRLPGEHVTPLSPLDLPGDADTARDIAGSGAVRLFTARAAEADPRFALTDDNAAAVAAICARLDGLPLALELAAVRVRSLGVDRLAAELADRLPATEIRGLPERQRSLRAVIDWSWELLGPDERHVLSRLATTSGGARLDAVTALCEGDLTEAATVDALASLVDRSLVDVATTGPDRRYRLLASVAVYCRDRLRDAGELDHAARVHRDVYTALAEGASDALRGPDQCRMLVVLDSESGNLHAALETSLRLGDAEAALRHTVGLTWYWYLRSHLVEARRSFEAALAVDGPADADLRTAARFWLRCFTVVTSNFLSVEYADEIKLAAAIADPHRRAYAELFVASTMLNLDDHAETERLSIAGRERFETTGDQWGMAAADANLAWIALVRGDLRRVRALAVSSRDRFAELGDTWGELQAIEPLAVHAEIAGDYALAHRLNNEAFEHAENLGLRMEAAYRLSRLGRVEMLTGDFAEARRLHLRSLDMGVEQSVRFCQMFAETGLMLVERRDGNLEEAERIARAWLEEIPDVPGMHHSVAMLMDELGFAAEMRGDGEEALRLHRRSLEYARPGEDRAIALALEGLAGAWSLLGEPVRAARAIGTATGLREKTGAPLPAGERFDLDRIEPRLVEALGRNTFEKERRQGRGTDPFAYLD